MAQQVKWGVLGAASIAVQRVIPAMREAPSATFLALASRDESKARAIASALGAPRAYAGYEQLLADPDIDAVYIPLPNQLHFEWSMRALEAGKHVLSEKPLCVTSQDVERLCLARDRSGRHIEEAFAYRNHAQWTTVRDLIAGDSIGPVRAAHAVLAKQIRFAGRAILAPRARSERSNVADRRCARDAADDRGNSCRGSRRFMASRRSLT
jgi:predicted dehydrogenase